MSVSQVVTCVKCIHVRLLRTAENIWKRIDVFNGVFESLYLGQGLPFLAVIRRQVITELMQSFCQTPHPHLLPLAGLHAPFRRHLWLVWPLRRGSRSLRAAERQIVDLLVSGWVAHLRRRAYGIHLGVRGGGMMRVVIRSQGVPVGQNVVNRRIQFHLSYQCPRTAWSSKVASRLEDKLEWRWSRLRVFILISGVLWVHRSNEQRKAQVPKCELSEDIIRYHWGAKTAKWADNAIERKIIRLLFVGNSP